jgi:hypothetical protein
MNKSLRYNNVREISFERFLEIISKQISPRGICEWSEESLQNFRNLYDSKKNDSNCNLTDCAATIGRAIYAQDIECEW